MHASPSPVHDERALCHSKPRAVGQDELVLVLKLGYRPHVQPSCALSQRERQQHRPIFGGGTHDRFGHVLVEARRDEALFGMGQNPTDGHGQPLGWYVFDALVDGYVPRGRRRFRDRCRDQLNGAFELQLLLFRDSFFYACQPAIDLWPAVQIFVQPEALATRAPQDSPHLCLGERHRQLVARYKTTEVSPCHVSKIN